MKRQFNLGAVQWPGNAGVETQSLQPIPDGYGSDTYRVTHLLLDLRMNITTEVTTGDCDGEDMLAFLRRINVRSNEHNLTNVSGPELWDFLRYLCPHDIPVLPADMGPDETDDIHIKLHIPIENARQFMPKDFVLSAAVFNSSQIYVDFDGAAIGTDAAVNSASIQLGAMVDRKNDLQFAALPEIAAVTIDIFDHLPPGVYDAAFIQAPSTSFAAADFTSILLRAGGEEIIANMEPDLVFDAWHADNMRGPGFFGGYSWLKSASDQVLIPLIWPGYNPASNPANQLIDTGQSSLDFDCRGAAGTMKIIYRRYTGIDKAEARKQAAKMHIVKPTDLVTKRKTNNKIPLSIEKLSTRPGLKIIPVKILGARNRESLGPAVAQFTAESLTRIESMVRRIGRGIAAEAPAPASIAMPAQQSAMWNAGMRGFSDEFS